MKRYLLAMTLFVASGNCCFSQQNTWDKCTWLLGKWEGQGSGKPGEGGGSFSFAFDLDQKIMVRKSHSEYPAKNDKPRIVHDDLMFFYLDRNGVPSKAIYFDNEGHTINYTITYTDNRITLLSDKIPNAPVFRLVYTLLDKNLLDTRFEMSQDGQQFTTYIQGQSKKVQ